jgi:tRNA threonylcarbamoyladenosine biosynthesis protein TsaE
MTRDTLSIATEAQMEALGSKLAITLPSWRTIHLRGPLGAGKTTLVRGILRGLGHLGAVKSPTFTLVEPYSLNGLTLYHFDLYRLKDPEELEFLGIRDYLKGKGVCIIEWPEHGGNVLPDPDLDVMIEPIHDGRSVILTAPQHKGPALRDLVS